MRLYVPPIPRFPKSTSFTIHNSAILSLLPQAASSHHRLTYLLGQVIRVRVEKVLGGKEAHKDCGMSMVEELAITECAVSPAGTLLRPGHSPLDPGEIRHIEGPGVLCT